MKKLFIFYILFLFLLGCYNSEKPKQDAVFDLNNDGINDIEVSHNDDGSYYELIDRNFDSKIDESHFYNVDHTIVSSKIDDDLDGVLETQILYKKGSIDMVLSDIDVDGVIDIVQVYKNGSLIFAERY